MRCRMCSVSARHMRHRDNVDDYFCKTCYYICDMEIRYLVPSDELTEYNRPDTRWVVRRKAKLQGS